MRIISINMGNFPNSFITIYNENEIEKFIVIPNDYNLKNISDLIKLEIDKSFNPNARLIGDDFTLTMLKDLDIKSVKEQELTQVLSTARNYLLDLALNSNLNTFDKIEFKKLTEELDNLDVTIVNGTLRLIQKDNNIGKSRAICYLQYFVSRK